MKLKDVLKTYVHGDVKLNVGCGTRKKPGWVNCDLFQDPDVRMDMRERWPFADESVGTVYAIHVLEHFDRDEIWSVMAEAWRVLEYGGHLIGLVPHGHSDLAQAMPTHKMLWMEDTPGQFTTQFLEDSGLEQGLPLRPWSIEAKLCEPTKDFEGWDEEQLRFARRHYNNVYVHFIFVMRKVHA